MKYTLIVMVFVGLTYLWWLVAKIIEHGWPTHPSYYVAPIIEIGLGFLTCRVSISNRKRIRLLSIVLIVISIGIPIGFYNLDIVFLKPIGDALVWYFLTLLGIALYAIVKRKLSGKELTIAEKKIEFWNKILAFIYPIMILLLYLSKD